MNVKQRYEEKGNCQQKSLKECYIEAIDRYTSMTAELRKQIDFIETVYRKNRCLEKPLMQLQLLMRRWGKDEEDDDFKKALDSLDENIISFYQDTLSGKKLISILIEFETSSLLERLMEIDQMKRALQLRDLLKTMVTAGDPLPDVINSDKIKQFIERCE